MPYWLLPALAVLPTLLGAFLAIGIPWALALLPRRDWRDRVMVLALALALGPMLLTAVMFLLGTFLRITLIGALLAAAILALWGIVLAWLRKAREEPHPLPPSPLRREGEPQDHRPLAAWEKLVIAALILMALARIIHVAYWPFTAYDVLWVYGYNARVFTLTGAIPAHIGYYPQMIPLTYTFAQMAWGGVDDHAARMGMLVFAWGSILAAYLLGARLWNRRVGLLAAALWTFYPHHGQWAQFGDLEVPLTFFFTMAALFFVLAWKNLTPHPPLHVMERGSQAIRYGAIAGVMLGGALWIKPTAGALVWGIGLALLIEAPRARIDWPRLWPKARLVIVTGICAAPIGGMWYIRNILLGHPPVEFPPSYWLTQAQRSGQEFGWPLLILALLAVYLLLQPPDRRPNWKLLIPGTALMILGALPSAGVWVGTPTHRLTLEEIAVMILGAALYVLALLRRPNAPHPLPPSPQREEGNNAPRFSLPPLWGKGWGWGENRAFLIVALILPYFVTWFWSYSYHPRLAFAITPLQLAIVAALIAAIAPRLAAYVRPRRRQIMAGAALLCLIVPGFWLTIQSTAVHMILNDLPDDDAKQRNGNKALFDIVLALREAEAQGPINVLAPGNLRLPFFFPLAPINTDPVTDLSIIDDRVTHYISGGENDGAYRELGSVINPVRALPDQPRLAQSVRLVGDQDFWYELFTVNTALRYVRPDFPPVDQEVVFPGFAEMWSYGMAGDVFWPGRRIVISTPWRVFGSTDRNYTIYMHVVNDTRPEPFATWDHIPCGGLYPTYLWQPGEYVVDELSVYLYEDVPPGEYRVRMGLYDYETGERVPVMVNGEMTDGFTLVERITMLAEQPEGTQ